MDRDFERFPVEKKQIRFEEPPEMFFFDVDEDVEEAAFIRVDDLFADDPEIASKLTGKLTFTLFPRRSEDLVDSRMSRLIHRTMILTGIRVERPLEKIRIRPVFVQWQIELFDNDEPEQLAKDFRAGLEELIHEQKRISQENRFWSDNCFVSPADQEIPDETIIRVAKKYQEQQVAGIGK